MNDTNNAKLNVYKKVLQEFVKSFRRGKFIRDKIEEICCNEKFSTEEVNLFCL